MNTDVIIAYDISNQAILNSNTGSSTTNVTYPIVFRENEYTYKMQLYNVYPATYDASIVGEWKLGIGYVGVATQPLVESLNADFNTDPWADPANGKITALVNTHSVPLTTDLGTTAMKGYTCEIVANASSDTTTIALFINYAKNTVYST